MINGSRSYVASEERGTDSAEEEGIQSSPEVPSDVVPEHEEGEHGNEPPQKLLQEDLPRTEVGQKEKG